MKTNSFKRLWGVALGLVLLAAAPFTAFAQADAKTDAVPKTESKEAAAQKADKKTPSEQKAEAKEAAENKEITLELRGKICRGEFIFEGNTIRFSKGNPVPEDVTVDGKHWEDLSKPFELGYTPEFAKAGILQRDARPPRAYYVNVSEKKFSLRIDEDNKSPDPFYVKLAMKNQISHDILPWYRVSPKDSIGQANINLLYKVEAEAKKRKWNDSIKERKVILSGTFQGSGTFIFEGNRISYRHESGSEPYDVEINNRSWYLPIPFELPFEIETSHPEMVKTEGNPPVKLTKINEQRFEVYFNGPRSSPVPIKYTVTITPGKQPETK